MKQTLFTFMFFISLVLMTACGGSPVDKALAKLDDAIEKLEKKGDKMGRGGKGREKGNRKKSIKKKIKKKKKKKKK